MIKIQNDIISPDHKPFIIAEMSGNHNQSLERALQIVEAAGKAGVNALKIQTYTPETITFDGKREEFYIKDQNSLWKDKNLFQLYKEAHTPWEWHKPIFERAKALGMIAFSSPFDTTAVDFLESLEVPCYKIASFENTDHILLKRVAQTRKPVIMSTGVSTISDIEESINVLKMNGCTELILLKCTSTYPANPENTHLSTIPHMRKLYNCPIGLSDHTKGIGAAVAAVALGAVVIEKHFTLNRADGGVDALFSLEPQEMKDLVDETERAFLAMGKINYQLSEKEKNSLQFKRSLYIVENIEKGAIFTMKNVRSIRPNNGLHTRYYEEVLGKKCSKSVEAGTPLSWELITID